MAFSNKITGPQDYQNFYHTNKDGNIWLGWDGKPIPLQMKLTEATTTVSPHELWDSTETPHDPNLKKVACNTMIDPKTGQLMEIPLSPIKIHGDTSLEERELAEETFRTMLNGASVQDVHLINGNLAEIFRKLKEGTLEFPDPNNTGDANTNLQKLQMAERAKKALEQELFQVKLELKTQSNNFSKTLDTKLQDCQNKLENSQRQNQVLLDQIRQLQIGQDTYKNRTEEFHKQELDRLHTQYHTSSTALTNKIAQLQQQLQDLHNRQPPPNYTHNQTFDTTLNASLLHNLSTSLSMQTSIAKQQLLIQAKAYDGKDPHGIFDWLDEINRLSSQNGYTQLEVAIQTSRGSVHRYLQELQQQGLEWDKIKFKLRERYSDCSSSAAAQNKLVLLKQNGRPMHEYISNFTDLLEHAYNMQPSDPATKLLTTMFIDGIDDSNKFIRNKLREKTGTNLEWYFTESLHLQHKQEIRAIDYKPDTETQTINFTHATTNINAIRNNSLTCHKCNSPDHFIKDCPHNKPQTNYRLNSKTQQDSQLELLIETLTKLTKTLSNEKSSQSYNRQGNYQGNTRHSNPQSKSSYNNPKHANRQYNNYKGNPHRQTAHTNDIDDCTPSDVESDHCEDEGNEHHSETSDTESKNYLAPLNASNLDN